jgi:hypothetical protein
MKFFILKIEVSALKEHFKNDFLTTGWPKTFFVSPESFIYGSKTPEFVSTTVVFSVVLPLRTLFIVHPISYSLSLKIENKLN